MKGDHANNQQSESSEYGGTERESLPDTHNLVESGVSCATQRAQSSAKQSGGTHSQSMPWHILPPFVTPRVPTTQTRHD